MYKRNYYPNSQNNRTVRRQFSGTDLNIDEIKGKLANYDIWDVQVNRSGNMKTVTVSIENPTQKQLDGLEEIFSCENDFKSLKSECQDFFGSPFWRRN